jgi:hypothetical protein
MRPGPERLQAWVAVGAAWLCLSLAWAANAGTKAAPERRQAHKTPVVQKATKPPPAPRPASAPADAELDYWLHLG